jgi:hypothetical protein
MLGCISKLLNNSAVGEGMSHYFPEYSGANSGRISNMPQEAYSEEESVNENVGKIKDNKTNAAPYQQQHEWQLIFAVLLFLYLSSVLGCYLSLGEILHMASEHLIYNLVLITMPKHSSSPSHCLYIHLPMLCDLPSCHILYICTFYLKFRIPDQIRSDPDPL